MNYLDLTSERIAQFEKSLAKMTEAFPSNERLKEVLIYSIDGGGKRLRPILLLESYLLFENSIDTALPFAVALELIHTYSLVHDDLPCMDDDDFRRNRPTVHRQFDETLAVLGGDALLNTAYEIMLFACVDARPEKIRTATLIATYAGVSGMLEGQILDLYSEIHGLDDLIAVYEKKTGALIQAGTEAGAVLGGASKEQANALRDFGYHLGMAFQLQDDILDKKEDLEENNMNILHFTDEETAKKLMIEHTEKAIQSLDALRPFDVSRLESITHSLVKRDH